MLKRPAGVDGQLALADLDVLVACKTCTGSKLFLGNGRGSFTDAYRDKQGWLQHWKDAAPGEPKVAAPPALAELSR